jgi:hypothetical protein
MESSVGQTVVLKEVLLSFDNSISKNNGKKEKQTIVCKP